MKAAVFVQVLNKKTVQSSRFVRVVLARGATLIFSAPFQIYGAMPNLGRIRQKVIEVGQSSADAGPISVNFGKSAQFDVVNRSSKLANVRKKLHQSWQYSATLVEVGQISAELGPIFAGFGPSAAEVDPSLIDICQIWPKAVNMWPNASEHWLTSARGWSTSAKFGLHLPIWPIGGERTPRCEALLQP